MDKYVTKKAPKASEIAVNDSLESLFIQGQFGDKIPLVTESDITSGYDGNIEGFYELPDLKKYGNDRLFALRYRGEEIPEMGVRSNSVLVFTLCRHVDRDGVYAVSARNSLSLRRAMITDDGIRMVPLDGRRRMPQYFSRVSAIGRMVCCINTYE